MYLYDRASRVTHVAGLITEINQSFGKQKSNNLTRSLEAWCAFNPPGQAPLPDAAALLRLKTQLKIAILNAYKQWSRLTHHEWDGTGCLRAREAPRQSDDGKIDATVPRCWRTRIQCTIHTFFEENRDLFIQIEQAVAQKADASEQLKAAAAVIRAALVDPRSLCEDKVCQRVGDVLIAIDGNKMSTFAANNPSEWELLSLVLKKPLINPVKGSFVV
jgi:hypothetical protein